MLSEQNDWLLEPAGAQDFLAAIPSNGVVTRELLQTLEAAMMEMKTTKPIIKRVCGALTSCGTYDGQTGDCPKLKTCGTFNSK